jgi:hypothetical protein
MASLSDEEAEAILKSLRNASSIGDGDSSNPNLKEGNTVGVIHNCLNCAVRSNAMCFEENRVCDCIQEIKKALCALDRAIPSVLKSDLWLDMTHYLNDVIKNIAEHGVPFPICLYNNDCFVSEEPTK